MKGMDDLISREAAIEAIDEVEWYHQGTDKEMISGASSEEDAWYKADDVYKALQKVPSAQPGEWLENYVSAILQAGLEGREVSFKVGDRTFAVKEVCNDTRKSDC